MMYGMMYGNGQAPTSPVTDASTPTPAASATMPVRAPIVRRRAEPASLAIVYLLGIAAIIYATR